jgi:hypothetical protein
VTQPPLPEGYPDLHTFLLPTRAYLLSFRDQTLPTRRAAIADASSYFDDFDGDEGHRAQLALLGLMGEALQVVEDMGVLGHAFMSGIPGLSFYVTATAYEAANVNNFFAQAHKRDDDYYLRLAALKLGVVSATERFTFSPPLDDAAHAAVAAAEHATARLLRDHVVWLAQAWRKHRQFFHAFKHGALIANPDDVHLMKDRQEVIARMAVWRRRRKQAELGTHASPPLTDLAAYAQQVGDVAIDTAQYVAHTRLRVFDWVRFVEDGSIEELGVSALPWHFWFRGRDIDDAHIRQLEDRLGMRFDTTPDSGR